MNLRLEAERAWSLFRSHDVRWLGARVLLEAYKRSGWEARTHRPRAWRPDEWRSAVAPELAGHSPDEMLALWRQGPGAAWGRRRREPDHRAVLKAMLARGAMTSLVHSAEDILAGRFRLFSRHQVTAGFPPAWGADPLGPGGGARGEHWSRVSMGGAGGELKFVWELSRAAWAFTLARAYSVTGEERFAEGFWRLWTSWIDENPPNSTVQWKDGQECAFRLMATSFAVQLCANAAATSGDRFVRHLGAVAALARRIEQGRFYAQLQHNNHSMSEAAGVYTAGVMYPLLREGAEWRARGWQRLIGEADRLLRPDGTFTQKSHNYHRVMLHDYLWAASVADGTGDRFPTGTSARLERATEYLGAVVDADSGGAPNFGANDGALVLPLEEADYQDFRPTLAAARHLAFRSRIGPGQPGEETVLWLFGPAALSPVPVIAPEPAPVALEPGGIYTLRQAHSWVFTHAEAFRDRPQQADQLHVDLWWRGQNVARDPGTYVYFADPRLYAWFRGSRCHNTVSVDGRDQMEPGPRFLWATWAKARARVVGSTSDTPSLELVHDGYQRLAPPVEHQREVQALGGDRWRVVDRLRSSGSHRYTLHWLLLDGPHRQDGLSLVLETPRGPFSLSVSVTGAASMSQALHRAAEGDEAWGWESLHYAERTPALSFLVTAEGADVTFETLLTPGRPS
jgi:hypothetical protein